LTNRQKRKYFILLLTATIITVAAAGYFSASLKSEPEYLSKIDRLMFDKENQSPKFILTLPDKETPPDKTPKTEPVAERQQELPVTVEDFVERAPLVSKLPEIKNLTALKNIEIDEELTEQSEEFVLPAIGKNGRKPWIEYGQTATVAPNFSKVAVIVQKVGLDNGICEAVIKALPSEVSLSFSPYTPDIAERIKKARSFGHETYADLLLASPNVLKSDNGPLSMSLTLKPEENLFRLQRVLAVKAPIGGMVVNDGVADKDTTEQLKAFLSELKKRGLLMIDAVSGQEINKIQESGLARKKAEIVIDESSLTQQAIAEKLQMAERLARENGQVMIVAAPKPIIITALSDWFKTFSQQLTYEQMKEMNVTSFDKPFALVPASNLVVE